MEDYKLTQTKNQAMQEGRYTKFMLPGLYNKEGQQRAQVGPKETVQSSWYAPYEYVDPVKALLPQVEKLKARINEGTYSWYNPATGETVTDRNKLKILEPKIIAEFVRGQKDAYLNNPESKGFVISATDWGTKPFTNELWEKTGVEPLSMFDTYEQETERTTKPGPAIQAPTTTTPKTDGGGNTVQPNQGKTYAFTTANDAYVPQVSSYLNPEVPITSQPELDDEIKQTTNQLAPLVTAVYQMTGVNTQGRDLNALIQDSGLRQQARDNWNAKYVKNAEGHYIPRAAGIPNVTYQQEQAFEQWDSLITSIDSAKGLRDYIKETAGVDNYNPKIIEKVKSEAQNTPELNRLWNDWVKSNKDNPDFEVNTARKRFLELYKDKIKENTDNIFKSKEYINTPEGKIYRIWDELNNRMEEMQVVNFDNDKLTENILGVLLTNAQDGSLPVKDFLKDKRLDKDKLDDEFTSHIPINKTTGLPDFSQIHLGMAFDRKDGLVGLVTMGGRKYEFDISKNPGSNIDKLLIEAHPELKEPAKFFDQVYKSLNQTSGTKGKFTLGANSFVFDHKSENLGKGAPKFEYEYDFDGTGKKRTTNLYEIYSAAAGVNNKLVQDNTLQTALTAQEITSEYTRMIAAAGMDRNKIEAATNWYYQKQDEALKEQLAREKASVGKTMGKQMQFRQTPKTPLQ
jgi:hypothetical protein